MTETTTTPLHDAQDTPDWYLAPAGLAASAIDPAIEAHLQATASARLESYKEFLRIPSVGTLAAHADDCRRTAEWIAAQLSFAGLEHVEVCETTGHPVVYADWLHAEGAPTVIIYGHYDVQPVDPLDLWTSPPFEPVVVGDRMLARGAADDKGQVHLHLMAAEALMRTTGRFPVNVKYLFEGDEEGSSHHLDAWLARNRDRMAADVAIISDSGFFEDNLPSITVGLRGIMYAQIDVVGTAVDLHSGSFGGAVENPALALARILAALKGPDGRISIPGFYDAVEPLSEVDHAAMAALPFDEAAYQAHLGVPALVGEAGYSTLERRATRPTLDVNGIWGGFEGDGSKTIIPAHAHAKVSCRLVPNQDPDAIYAAFEAFVRSIAPPGVTTTTRSIGGGRAFRTAIDHPATQAAARAIEATFGRAPLYIREGGSIPVSATFASGLELPVVLMGFTPPNENAHAPNEWMDLRNYETAIRTVIRFLDEMAGVGR